VSDLTILREGWDMIEREELRLLRAMTVQESLEHWVQLQKAFEWQLQRTADLFEPQRHAALVELQVRLYRLVGE